jgi:hypothetical protein
MREGQEKSNSGGKYEGQGRQETKDERGKRKVEVSMKNKVDKKQTWEGKV